MKCKVAGCDRDAMYKADELCQKHYFRFRRTGGFDIVKSRKYRSQNPAGYQKLYEPNHPLAMKDGNVYEHRMVVHNKYGDNLPVCELCGKSTNWETCHIDHRDNDTSNNKIENLRPVCNPCNTRREYPIQHTMDGRLSVTYNGLTMTPEEWGRVDGIPSPGYLIRQRLNRGMSVEDSFFSPKLTHNGKKRRHKPRSL